MAGSRRRTAPACARRRVADRLGPGRRLQREQILAGDGGLRGGGDRGLAGQHLGQERRRGEHRVALAPHRPVHRDDAGLHGRRAEERAQRLQRLLGGQAAHAARGEGGQSLGVDQLGHPGPGPQPPVDAERGPALARPPVGEGVEERVGRRIGPDERRAQHPRRRGEQDEEVERLGGEQPVQEPGTGHLRAQHIVELGGRRLHERPVVHGPGRVHDPADGRPALALERVEELAERDLVRHVDGARGARWRRAPPARARRRRGGRPGSPGRAPPTRRAAAARSVRAARGAARPARSSSAPPADRDHRDRRSPDSSRRRASARRVPRPGSGCGSAGRRGARRRGTPPDPRRRPPGSGRLSIVAASSAGAAGSRSTSPPQRSACSAESVRPIPHTVAAVSVSGASTPPAGWAPRVTSQSGSRPGRRAAASSCTRAGCCRTPAAGRRRGRRR